MCLPAWASVYGGAQSQGIIRQCPEDFRVNEIQCFALSGEGEHAFIQVQKRGENTEYIARQLARFAGVRQRDVSFAGLKDRHAITTQWFSVWLPGKPDPDWAALNTDKVNILQATRHSRKLKRGALAGNYFSLKIRDWRGDKEILAQQLSRIRIEGVPNYFGEQRFGRQGANIDKARAIFDGEKIPKEKRGIYLSAARSYLFNEIVNARIKSGSWTRALLGDVLMLNNTHSFFKYNTIEADNISRRLDELDIHLTAVLYGKGEPETSDEVFSLEQIIIEKYNDLAKGLITFGLKQERRAMRCEVKDLQWQFVSETCLELSFSLTAGSYATSVLKEIMV